MSNSNITKKAIADSFKALMETTPFDKISVSEITDGCGLNRQTFYYHFQDKFELINWIFYQEIISEMMADIDREDCEIAIERLFRRMKEEKNFYLNAIQYTNASFNKYIYTVMKELLIRAFLQTEASEEKEFLASFFAHGITGIITAWIKQGMKEEPLELAGKLAAVSDFERLVGFHRLGRQSA